MSNDAPELSKGVFGYRKSVVNQIIADRDIMLRQAEGRVRAAEGKVAELESELQTTKERNERMEDQLDRLRSQLDSLLNRVDDLEGSPSDDPPADPAPAPAEPEGHEVEPSPAAPWAESVGWLQEAPDAEVEEAAEDEPVPEPEPFAAMADEGPGRPDDASSEPFGIQIPPSDEAAMFGEPLDAPADGPSEEDDMPFGYQASLEPDPVSPRPAWMDLDDEESSPEAAEASVVTTSTDGVLVQPDDEPSWAAEHDPFAEERRADGAGEGSAVAPEASLWHEAAPVDEGSDDLAQAPETPSWMDDDEEDDASGGESYAWASLDEPEAEEPVPFEVSEAPSYEDTDVPESPAASAEEPEAPKLGVSPETSDITNRFVTKELAGILAAAEESAARIVERARSTSQRQVAHSNRLWREVQSEVSRFADWRDDVEPVIRAVQDKVDGVRSQIEQVPERIRQALAPMAEAIASIDADLAELAAAANPPLLLAPNGLEDAMEEDWDLDLEDPGTPPDAGDQPSPEADAG